MKSVGRGLFGLFVALAVIAWAAPWALADSRWADTRLSWRLTDARVVNFGRSAVTGEGTFVTGYVIEAVAGSGQTVPEGEFRVVCDAFSPRADGPGRKAGLWYIRGAWEITDGNATAAERMARHSRAKVRGRLTGVLPFNPTVRTGPLSAEVRLPMAPAAGRWARGAGSFSGNTLFEGRLVLDVKVGPAMDGRPR